MKKLFPVILALTLLFTASVTAFAADLNESNNVGTTIVSYGVSEGYVVTVPADIVISTEGVESTLTASSVLIPEGKTLTVSVTSQNGFRLQYASSVIPYTVSIGETEQTEVTFDALSIASGTTSGSVTMVFQTTADDIAGATQGGNHTDTLTFECTIN